MAPQVGLEPTTTRLTAECSASELLRNMGGCRRAAHSPAQPSQSAFSALCCSVPRPCPGTLSALSTACISFTRRSSHWQRKKRGNRDYFVSVPRKGIRQRPTLPGRLQPSTIGAERLNFCVRDGNRWDPLAIATGNCIGFSFTPSKLHSEKLTSKLCLISCSRSFRFLEGLSPSLPLPPPVPLGPFGFLSLLL